MMAPKTATTPFSEAASLQHYTKKSSLELKCLAKLRSLSRAGSQQEIVARLMAQDKETDTWPGMYEAPNMTAPKTIVVGEKKDGKGAGVAPVKQVSAKDEKPSETKITAEVKPKTAVSATVSRNATMTTSIAGATSTGSSKNGPAIPMSQLADEWDQQWGAPYAFPRRATITKSQGTPRVPSESVSSRSKSPVTPASPASPVSPASPATPVSPTPTVVPTLSKSNRYDLLFSEEEGDGEPEEKEEEQVILPVKKAIKAMREAEVETSVESPVIVRDYGDIAQPSPPTTPKTTPVFAEMSSPKQVDGQGISYLAPSPVQATDSAKKTPIKIFVTPPPSLPPAAAQPTSSPTEQPASVPTTTKSQRRNEKRKQDKAVAPANIYDTLAVEESEDLLAQTDDYGASDSESAPTVRVKKSKKRGKKGGKKVQAQKQKEDQAVAPALVQQVVVMPTNMAAPAAVGTVVLVAIVAAVLCAWVVA
jgi:hypothetical protein